MNDITKQIRINQSELAELLQDEIIEATASFNEVSGSMEITLVWVTSPDEYLEDARLHHMISDQTYYIIDSTSPDMTVGNTISVDEILDIVLAEELGD